MTTIARRAGWGFLDQVLSSATNFGLGVFVAATVSPEQFGAFSVVYGVYGICLGVSAGFASNPLVVRFSAAEGARLRAAQQASVGTALAIGLGAGLICLATSFALDAEIGRPLLALALVLPGLLVQDAWRFSFMAGRAPRSATANDAVWAVLQVMGIGLLAVTDSLSAASLVLVWGGSATLAAGFGCFQAHARPALSQARGWLRCQRDLGPRYALESMAHRSGVWLALAAVGFVAGLPAVAALRGGLLLVTGPLNLLMLGLGFAVLPEAVRLYDRTPARLPRAAGAFSVALIAVSSLWASVVIVWSGDIGPVLLGDTWSLAEPLLVVLSVHAVVLAASAGPSQGLWAMGAARDSLATQVVGVLLLLPSTAVGAAVNGAYGAATGLAVSATVTSVLWWHRFSRSHSRALRDRPQRIAIGPASTGAQELAGTDTEERTP